MLRLNTLVFVTTILYFFLDKYLGIYVEWYIYVGFLLFTIYNYLLIHKGLLNLSRVSALVLFNIMVFLIASSEPFETGMHLQFVTAGAVALALYGYEKWNWAIGFVLFSVTLDILSFKTDISFIPWRTVDPDQAQVFAVLNTIITASVSVYTILLISKYDYDSEVAFRHKEKEVNEQNEQLLKTNTELDRFVYSASHDLRAPLSTIQGLVSLIEFAEDEEEKRKYLELIKDRIKSMNSFISEIVDYSRNSRLELANQLLNIKDVLESTYEELLYMPNSDKIKVRWNCQKNINIHSDEMRLKMVFSNLISNAIKYQDFRKETSWLKISCSIKEGDVLVNFEDNGLGIAEQYQKNIFNMFFRAHENVSGTGLGLYIAKETMVKLSGDISVDSTLGHGSKFTVTFPTY